MEKFQGSIQSKLRKQETSIFAIMSTLAREHNAINLSQGVPGLPHLPKTDRAGIQIHAKGAQPVCAHDRYPGVAGAAFPEV